MKRLGSALPRTVLEVLGRATSLEQLELLFRAEPEAIMWPNVGTL